MGMNEKSGLERPQLGQLLDVMIPSDRIKIFDGESEKDPVLYTGFVACLDYAEKHIDSTRIVKKSGLGVDIFRKENPGQWNTFAHTQKLAKEIPVESISDFKYSDLEEIIYTRIFLEVATDGKE